MNQRKPSQDKELLETIKRFQEMKKEGKILYLDAEQYEDIVEYYIFSKAFDDAAEVIETAMQIHPGNTKLIATRVALYIDEGKLKKARETLNTVLSDNSFHVRLIHAELLVVEGREAEAHAVIDTFKEDETDEMDCLDIGSLCYDVGFNEKAMYWLEKCLAFNAENEDAILTTCECYQAQGKYRDTIELYNKLIDKDPYSAENWSGLAKSYFYMGQFDKAVEACDFALVSDNKAGDAYTIKGHAYYQLENYQESVEAYKEAWRLESLEAEFAPMFIAFSYIGMEEWDNAYEYIKKAIARTNENSPVFADLLINSARCLHHMGSNAEAHSTLEFVQERFPSNTLAYIYNGKYYLIEGEKDKAIKNFEEATTINPTADTWCQIGHIAMVNDELEIARDAFAHAEEIDPQHEDLLESIAYVTSKGAADHDFLKINRKILKQTIRNLVASGEEPPKPIDIDGYVKVAQEEGKSEEEIDELIAALEQLNDLLENYYIDQEEDEIDEIQ